MKIVRRDHSISPTDRSKTRNDDGEEARRFRDRTLQPAVSVCHRLLPYFTRYWKTACRLSSGDVTSSMAPNSPLAAISVSRA